jgi:CheY-like chemotaxis protein/two-component sensor histidine kinase
MLVTVNDILDLRKIESQTLKLLKTRVPYGRLVRRSVQSLMVQARQKSINMEIASDERLWFVDCDAQKIERVIINLVGNAIKFTSEGGRIIVSVGEDSDFPGFVRVTVDDDGIGIPQESIEHVTDRYYTVGDQPCGSGLGLAISKEIVAMHGGELIVKSPVPGTDKGTRIAFRLPVTEPPTVLIVEPDPEQVTGLKTQIGEHGYQVIASQRGVEALGLIAINSPDIIILDLQLPDIDGRDVIMKLKGDPDTVRIPILAMTSAHLERTVATVLRNFGIPVVSKPCSSRNLLDGIANAFMRSLPFMVS